MSVASAASGSQTATISTEHTLATVSTAGVYVLVVDTYNMVNGDIVVLRLKTKCKTGSTSQLAFMATYAHAQSDLNKYSLAVPVDTELVATLQQTDGTGRVFDWNILKVG